MVPQNKIYYNKYLMEYIYEFDDTYRNKFKNLFIYSLDIFNKAEDIWHNKYLDYLKNDKKNTIDVMNFALNITFCGIDLNYQENPTKYNHVPISYWEY
jgi:hypothetical protein